MRRLRTRAVGLLLAALTGGACATESSTSYTDMFDDTASPSATDGSDPQAPSGPSASGGDDSDGAGAGDDAGVVADGGGLPPAPGLGPDGRPADCVVGETAGESVLLIGDSYLALNNKAFGKELQRLARLDGSLAEDDSYQDYSLSGTQMAGGIFPIPSQYRDRDNSDGHIKTVVMDGGGNDVLVGNRGCISREAPPANQSCVETIDKAMKAARELLAEMADDGVEHVIYFFYPHLPGGGLGGDKELSNMTIDYAIPRVKQICEEAPVDCHFVDTRGLFPAEPDQFQDGIHPIVDNTHKISAKVWETMKAHCIAQ